MSISGFGDLDLNHRTIATADHAAALAARDAASERRGMSTGRRIFLLSVLLYAIGAASFFLFAEPSLPESPKPDSEPTLNTKHKERSWA
jgi:hypothetical protein